MFENRSSEKLRTFCAEVRQEEEQPFEFGAGAARPLFDRSHLLRDTIHPVFEYGWQER